MYSTTMLAVAWMKMFHQTHATAARTIFAALRAPLGLTLASEWLDPMPVLHPVPSSSPQIPASGLRRVTERIQEARTSGLP